MTSSAQPSPNQSDILEVIANLSNNEVFTPPRRANEVLDLLPASVWTDPNLRWLDPASKTGVFPREITRRLMKGLAPAIPDEAERLHHILTKMVHAIAITEMTAMMTRRSLYCSKDGTSVKSAASFEVPEGNVWFRRTEHAFDGRGRCEDCGGSRAQLEKPGRDNHAYALIHRTGRQVLEKEMMMKFDVVVGNPPYQMDADVDGQNIVPLYDTFVEEAIKLNPQYVTMIIPSRWMTGGKDLDRFRQTMLADQRLRKLIDFATMTELFPGVDFEGGICYFLWDRDYEGDCEQRFQHGSYVSPPEVRSLSEFDVVVRDARALPILRKVLGAGGEPMSQIVSTRDPFGSHLTTSFRGYRTGARRKGDVTLYVTEGGKRAEKVVPPEEITRNHEVVSKWKLLVPKAYGERGAVPARVLGPTQIAPPGTAASVTFLFAGPVESREECESLDAYLRTKFARFLVSLRKLTQNLTQSSFAWLPQQSWDRKWGDDELYERYQITSDEQTYIASMVKELTE